MLVPGAFAARACFGLICSQRYCSIYIVLGQAVSVHAGVCYTRVDAVRRHFDCVASLQVTCYHWHLSNSPGDVCHIHLAWSLGRCCAMRSASVSRMTVADAENQVSRWLVTQAQNC
jgi:hypothetical protein